MELAKTIYQQIRTQYCPNCCTAQQIEVHYLDNGKIQHYCLWCYFGF